ncbi:helix-turn-helix domain-containing protein [Gaoshiqia sp. Z1-71]|uniref:helix-turn-helix domain-containing protein n=1 Tax=Gaoshiqia hydrogeniformans TaxID=3290090 RepID=UPI003BF8E4EF
MEIFIKNMVCNRCILVVSNIFQEAGIDDAEIQLGKLILKEALSEEKFTLINKRLQDAGFEIINDSKSRLIEQIKKIAIDFVYRHPAELKINFSDYLSEKLHLDYNHISSLFSSVAGTTIEKYLINLKIERVKELLVYDEKTLSEIADEVGYSSVAHLSGQFKKVSGFTPSYFKKLGEKRRKPIDQV